MANSPILYPAIDLRGGRAVRLERGDFAAETVYDADPVERARAWVEAGAEALHVVDLDGAVGGRPANRDLVVRIAREAPIPVQVGGGIRDVDSAADYLSEGLARVILGTLALRQPEEAAGLARRFPGRVVLGLDLKEGRVAVDGWTRTEAVGAIDLLTSPGARAYAAAIVTDVGRDGLLAGPNEDLYRGLVPASPIPIIASGGVSTLADLEALARLGVAGIVVGKALYEGRFALADAIRATAAGAACGDGSHTYNDGHP